MLRFIKFAKVTVLASAVWTVFCASSIFSWQFVSWLRYGAWDGFSISSLVTASQPLYETASADQIRPQRILFPAVIDWMLGLPAILPLVIAAALLFAFYARLTTMEKQLQ
jgi:hypothetical protein